MQVDSFNQPPPELGNQYDDDPALRAYLDRVLPQEFKEEIAESLGVMGEHAGGELYQMQLEDRLNEPTLTQWDAWGERIDQIEVSPLWKRAEKLAAEAGVVATAYERKHGRFSRVHQFALTYLFSPSTDIYSCPLAMTDGAAYTLTKMGNQALMDHALPHLTSRDPGAFWTSGQWMTESTGGSDVGQSETVAALEDGEWRLYGRKWFTSATTSPMALTLGRPEGNGPGGSGLALFYVEIRDEDGQLKNIRVNRLKDKLGTRKVPTAEIMLDGTPATLVTEDAKNGVRNITPMLTITRTWNAVTSAAGMARALNLARSYAKKRVAFGAKLSEKPLHLDTLAAMAAEHEGALQLAFFVAELLGRDECDELDEHQGRLLRLLTPVAKLTTAKQAVAVASEGLECFGGAGYVEDTGLPTLLRDAQVLPIWEGTTNVLSLDTLRAMNKDPSVLGALATEIGRIVEATEEPGLRALAVRAGEAVDHAATWAREAMQESPAAIEAGARRFALTLGRATELALLVRQAQYSLGKGDGRAAAAARRFALAPFDLIAPAGTNDSRLLALGCAQ
ncbi:MAG: acyl-CoA dehydrogenase [Deltaproteobacteria bacterium]|nr:MAG: acyl-CoA dehydrogenase [Deltaproteobacteria bacterium]